MTRHRRRPRSRSRSRPRQVNRTRRRPRVAGTAPWSCRRPRLERRRQGCRKPGETRRACQRRDL